jgi:arylsulfatase A-like enzyme
MTLHARGAERPNIVLLYLDDWAWNGTPVAMDDSIANASMPILEMPRLERLASEGMKFSNAYGSHQCAPARASLQTGQSGPRTGLTLVLGKSPEGDYDTSRPYQNLPMVPNTAAKSLNPETPTIPQILAPLGYVSAHLGKWHLYSDPGEAGYVLHDGDTNNDPGSPTDPEVAAKDPKLMFSMTEKAIGFIEEQVKAGKPFYCQISHYAMHERRQCRPETRAKYQRHPLVQTYYETTGKSAETISSRQDPATWFGMAEDLDGRIGAVLDTLDRLGVADETYVIVISDNGYRHKELMLTPGAKQPLHGNKWWAWQAGIRVPMIPRGPGLAPGSTFQPNVTNYTMIYSRPSWIGRAEIPTISKTSMASVSRDISKAKNLPRISWSATSICTCRTTATRSPIPLRFQEPPS